METKTKKSWRDEPCTIKQTTIDVSDGELLITPQKFRNKKTGEIATQINLLEINDWEKVEEDK